MASWSSAWTSSRRAWDCSCDFMPFLCSSSGGILSLIPSRNLRFVFRSQLKWSFVFNARLFTVRTTWTKGVSTTLLLHKPQSHPKSFPIKALHKHKRDLPTWCHRIKELGKKTCNIRKYIHYSWYTKSDHGLFRMTSPFATSATTWNRPPCLENVLKWQHPGMFLHAPSRVDYSSLRDFFFVCVCAPVLDSFSDTMLRCFRLSWLLIVLSGIIFTVTEFALHVRGIASTSCQKLTTTLAFQEGSM